MPYPLSTKLDSTLRYFGGLYGLSASVLAQLASALADAVTAVGAAAVANSVAATAQGTANTAQTNAATASAAAAAAQTAAGTAATAAAAAQTTANTANTAAGALTARLIDYEGLFDDVNNHIGAGGNEHALATASVHGFMASTQFSKLATLAAGQSGTVGKLTVDTIIEAPTTFAYASSYAIDTSIKNDYVASGTLTGNITFTFSNAAAGHQGLLAVRQDATGGRTVTFTAPATWTLYRDAGTPNLAAAAAANAVTVYSYAFVDVGGVKILLVSKLTPVAA